MSTILPLKLTAKVSTVRIVDMLFICSVSVNCCHLFCIIVVWYCLFLKVWSTMLPLKLTAKVSTVRIVDMLFLSFLLFFVFVCKVLLLVYLLVFFWVLCADANCIAAKATLHVAQ